MKELNKLRTYVTPHCFLCGWKHSTRIRRNVDTVFIPKHHLPYLRFMATTIPYGGHAANNWQVLAHFRPVLVIGLDDS